MNNIFDKKIEYVSDEKQRKISALKFLHIHHKGYLGSVSFATKNNNNSWYQYKAWSFSNSPNINNNKDTYVTVNEIKMMDAGMENIYGAPKMEEITLIRAMFIDIDIHKVSKEVVDENCRKILDIIPIEQEKGHLPHFSIINLTGGGLALYVVYDKPISTSDEKSMALHMSAYEALQNRLTDILNENGINGEVDMRVRNVNRVCRIPGYYHTKTERYATLYYADMTTVSLNEVVSLFSDKELKEKRINTDPVSTEKKSTVKRKKFTGEAICDKQTALSKNCAKRRMEQICQIMENRGGREGDKRHNSLFLYWHISRIIYPDDIAKRLVLSLNEHFLEPFTNDYINKAIFNCLDTFIFSSKAFSEYLSLSAAEEEMIGLYDRKRRMERQSENGKIKKEKKQKAILMKKEGKSASEIAKELSVSRATVYNWLKDLKEEIKEEVKAERKVVSFDSLKVKNFGDLSKNADNNKKILSKATLKNYSTIPEYSTLIKNGTLIDYSTLVNYSTLLNNDTLVDYSTLLKNNTLYDLYSFKDNNAYIDYKSYVSLYSYDLFNSYNPYTDKNIMDIFSIYSYMSLMLKGLIENRYEQLDKRIHSTDSGG